MWDTIRENPRAVMYAVLMHVVLLVLLVISLDWTPKISRKGGEIPPIQAELVDHRQLEAVEERKRAEQRQIEEARRKAEAERIQKAEQEARRDAEAEQKRKAEQETKRKAEDERKRKIALEAKRKAEAEQKRKAEVEQKRKAEAEKKRKAEAEQKRKAEAEKKRKAEAEQKRKAEAEKKRKAEEARRREAEQALQAQLAAEEAQRAQGVLAEYTAYIQEKIQRNWLRPPGSPAGLSCVVQVSLIPGGDVSRVEIVRSSGDPVFDRSVETAVFKAAPLPLPRDSAMFKHFRELRLIFKPN